MDGDSEEEEDLSHLPPEIKQLREKERRSANNAREVREMKIKFTEKYRSISSTSLSIVH